MTATQKVLGLVGVAGLVTVVLALAFGNKDDPKKTSPGVDPPTSNGIVETTSTTSPAAPRPASSVPETAPLAASGKPIDMATLAQEAKAVASAREALSKGDPRKALTEIERYERIPDRGALTPEATLVKIEALAKVNRRTDALALGMSTRDDPKMAPYQARVDALLQDAGLIGEPPPPAAR